MTAPLRILTVVEPRRTPHGDRFAWELARFLADAGRVVGIADLDPDAHLTNRALWHDLGIDRPWRDSALGWLEAWMDQAPSPRALDVLRPTLVPGVHVVPARPYPGELWERLPVALGTVGLRASPAAALSTFLDDLLGAVDLVVVYAGPGLGWPCRFALGAAEQVIANVSGGALYVPYAQRALTEVLRTTRGVDGTPPCRFVSVPSGLALDDVDMVLRTIGVRDVITVPPREDAPDVPQRAAFARVLHPVRGIPGPH